MSLDNSSLDKGKYLQGVQDMGTLHRQIGDLRGGEKLVLGGPDRGFTSDVTIALLRELGKLTQPVIHGFHSRRS